MRRFDFCGGFFLRIGRWWFGLIASWPFAVRLPVIAGGADVTDTFYAGEAFIGYGAQLEVGDGASPETFEAVADVMEIVPGDMSTGIIPKTHLRSPEAHHEKLLGIRDSGPFTVRGNWRPTHESQSNAGGGAGSFTDGGLIAIWRRREERNFRIVLADGSPATVWPFRGGVTKFQPGGIVLDQKVDFTCEITPLRDFSADLP